MAATTKRLLQLRPTFQSLARPYPHTQHHFAFSSDCDDVPQSEQPLTQSSDSPNLDAIIARLRNQSPPPDRRQPFASSGGAQRQTPRPTQGGSCNEISAMLAEFRSRAAPPPPSQHSGGGYVSMWEHYEKLVNSNADGAGGRGSMGSIRESLSNLLPNGAGNPGGTESLSFSLFTEKLGNKADPNAGGSVKLVSPFSKEKKKWKGGVGAGSATMELWTSHERWSLGKKLMKMRPEKRDGKWFSLQELSDRLAKVRMADQEKLKKLGIPVEAINKSFKNITWDKEEKDRARSFKPLSLVGSMATEAGPPKDHLVEICSHPLIIRHLLRK